MEEGQTSKGVKIQKVMIMKNHVGMMIKQPCNLLFVPRIPDGRLTKLLRR